MEDSVSNLLDALPEQELALDRTQYYIATYGKDAWNIAIRRQLIFIDKRTGTFGKISCRR